MNTQEQKGLLLKDLCGRLPHGVKCKILETNEVKILGSIQYDGENTLFDFWDDKKKRYEYQLYLSEFKPYLFPISSMTEEQKKELEKLYWYCDNYEICNDTEYVYHNDCSELIDWINKNHFDYRGLIPMGLANDATGLNIY